MDFVVKRCAATCLMVLVVAAGCGGSPSSVEPGTSEVLGTTVVVAETTAATAVSVPVTTTTTSVPATTMTTFGPATTTTISVPVTTTKASVTSAPVTTETSIEATPTEAPPIPTTAPEEAVSSTSLAPIATTTPESASSFPSDEFGDFFEVEFDYDGYLCRDTWEWEQYECVGYTGGPVPSFLFPDLYCSGARDGPDCSEYWYLNELNQYDFRTIEGSAFLCQRALAGGWDDYDCSRYSGGDPDWVSFYRPDLRCTEWGTTLECDSDDYPSELEQTWEDECEDEWGDEWEDEWEEDCW